jgi:hypothetical protein
MYIDINTWFTFEVSKSDDQSILAAIVHEVIHPSKYLFKKTFVFHSFLK